MSSPFFITAPAAHNPSSIMETMEKPLVNGHASGQSRGLPTPKMPAVLKSVLTNFEGGYALRIDHDAGSASFQNASTELGQFKIEYDDAVEMEKALTKGRVQAWFNALYPGRLIIIQGGQSSENTRRNIALPAPEAGPFSEFVLVTPEMAGAWLERNISNRPMDAGMVSRYTMLMRSGRFMLTGDAIQFDTEGRLVNGQHRLKAILNAGLAQEMLVVRGLDPKVFKVLDYGKRRSPSDALHIEGFVNARNLAALCKLIYAWMIGKLGSGHRVSAETDDIVDIAYRFDIAGAAETASGAVRFAHGHYPSFRRLLPLSNVSFVYWAYARLGEAEKMRARLFVSQLATGVGITESTDPVYKLRSMLLKDALDDKKLPDYMKFGYTIQAARLFMAGEQADNLRWTGDFPEPGLAPPLE